MNLPPKDDPGMHLLYALHKRKWPVLVGDGRVRVVAPDREYEVPPDRLDEMERGLLIDLRGERPAPTRAGMALLDRWCHRHYVRPAMRSGAFKRGRPAGKPQVAYAARPSIRLAPAARQGAG